ncbi:MAG: dihydropteroate synthase [Gemmataceae bacterium]|nr:dihydropteroate synthase [Gemmataceae bacterium]
MPPFTWIVRDRRLTLERPLVMGILNVTPDSFSDGGQFLDPAAAVAHAEEMRQQGADIIDVGGESTRPGSVPVPADEELRRVLPVVRELARNSDVLLSIDTSKAAVARACLEAGAHIINDVTALAGDPAMPQVVREFNAGAILMHMQGTPQTMQINPQYDDVVREVHEFLRDRVTQLTAGGVAPEQLVVDPGIGFGKKDVHNIALLAALPQFLDLQRPICLGVSRKGLIGKLTGRPLAERAVGSVAVACFAMTQGAAHILRVHDVPQTVDAVKVITALRQAASPPL